MNDKQIDAYFKHSQQQLELSAQKQIAKLRVSDRMIDALPECELRSWLRFLLKQYVKLQEEEKKATALYRAEIQALERQVQEMR